MTVQDEIDRYIAGQPKEKRDDMQALHDRMLGLSPDCRLWFLDGRNDQGKVVSNPNIGYGAQSIRYANRETKEFYQVGVSGNSAGISVYIIGVKDRKYLSETYGKRLGKAQITGYCIKFKSLKDIDIDTLEEIVGNHMGGGLAAAV